MNAKTKEKIYIGSIIVLGILLLLKKKQKCPKCPSCGENGDTVINVPAFTPSSNTSSQSTSSSTTVVSEDTPMDPKEIEAMQVYNGPSKFKIPSPTKEDSNASWIYFEDAGRFYKYYNSTTNPKGYESKVEIPKQEMISAWNSINN